jgi:hypothetical protein
MCEGGEPYSFIKPSAIYIKYYECNLSQKHWCKVRHRNTGVKYVTETLV